MGEQEQIVFISGGGSGIGLFLAHHYATEGARVAVFDLHVGAEARDTITSSTATSAPAFYNVDVRAADELAAAVEKAAAQMGPPNLAINCAGTQCAAPFTDLTTEQFSRVIDINLLGSRNFAAACLPHMRRGDRLALVASLAGLVPSYAYTAYNASKFGVVGLAGALRMECLPLGISLSVICPPEVNTPMVVEERKTMKPVTRELKKFAGTLDLDTACRQIIRGLEKGDYLIVPGARARMIERLGRWFPGLLRRSADRIILKMTAH